MQSAIPNHMIRSEPQSGRTKGKAQGRRLCSWRLEKNSESASTESGLARLGDPDLQAPATPQPPRAVIGPAFVAEAGASWEATGPRRWH